MNNHHSSRPLISICILAYNRADFMPRLLESILPQVGEGCEVVISEDQSAERKEIRGVVENFQARYPGKISYAENEQNLGYDGNFRRIVELAQGEYCLFMGNDDLLAPGAVEHTRQLIQGHPKLGAILRSYQAIHYETGQVEEVFRYFDRETTFQPGVEAMAVFYRRFVVISGLVLHRDTAHRVATDRFDGSLLYQLYLVGRVLAEREGVATPYIMAHYRQWGVPEHGMAQADQGKFIPKQITPEGSLHFISEMMRISRALEEETKLPVAAVIWRDLCAYCYPFLSLHARLNPTRYRWYAKELGRLGFARSPWFWIYHVGLLTIGETQCEKVIRWIKAVLGRTPRLG